MKRITGGFRWWSVIPGKLNQVFLNVMTNAIHAIKKKWGERAGGKMEITTYCNESKVFISIKDNGTGMDEQ